MNSFFLNEALGSSLKEHGISFQSFAPIHLIMFYVKGREKKNQKACSQASQPKNSNIPVTCIVIQGRAGMIGSITPMISIYSTPASVPGGGGVGRLSHAKHFSESE